MQSSQTPVPAALPPVAPPPEATRRDIAAGILLMVGAVACFACLDTSAKWLNRDFDPVLTAALRYIGSFLLVGTTIRAWGRVGWPRTRSPVLQVTRAAFLVVATVCSYAAFSRMPLTQATSITFAAPLIVAVIAGPLLGEWIGWRRGLAVAVGFLGVLVITRPLGGGFNPAFLLPLVVAVANALYSVTTRILAARDPSRTTIFYTGLVGAVVAVPVVPFIWTPPSTSLAWLVAAGLGAWGGLGHWLLILAHRRAPASVLAPFFYVQLLWATALGWLVFNELPDRWTLAGGSVVMASGLYLLFGGRTVGR